MKTRNVMHIRAAGLAVALGLALGACASPTAPRLPEPDEDKTKEPGDGDSSGGRWSAEFQATMALVEIA